MDSIILHLVAIDPIFLLEVLIKAGLDVVYDWLPAARTGKVSVVWAQATVRSGTCLPFVIVNEIAKARCVNHVEPQTNAVFLDVCVNGRRQ